MAEAAGLALGVVGVAGLFSTCIEFFDIVVAGRNFSDDYEQLCALFSLQRARFGLWGESVGVIPSPDGRCLRYNRDLDRPDIKDGVGRVLNNIKSLLDDAGRVDGRYGLRTEPSQSQELSSSRGIDIFKSSFERFKGRIRKHQKETSAWHVTRWAIHDAKKFEEMINKLEKFVDGLEGITKSLGLLEQQHARLQAEIESVSDIQSLKLLSDASSSYRTSLHGSSESASRCFIREVAESVLEQKTLASTSLSQGAGTSFVTARTQLGERRTIGSIPYVGSSRMASNSSDIGESSFEEENVSMELPVPGAWPKPRRLKYRLPIRLPTKPKIKHAESCFQCLQEHYKCTPLQGKGCKRCSDLQRICNLSSDVQASSNHAENRFDEVLEALGPKGLGKADLARRAVATSSEAVENIPQNQRLMNELIVKARSRRELSFVNGEANHGDQLRKFKMEDENYWLEKSGSLLAHAQTHSSAAKRMFFELRNIRAAKVPFVTAAPVKDSLDKVLASIEGPPETPYEGGVFWITVKLPESDPFGPPMMRFQTKIYHPNISPQGEICADYRERWRSVLSAGVPVRDPSSAWYPAKSTDIRWSLGALLTALCGLLASPDVDDPLVPEIAQKYLEDYDGYCQAAQLYTEIYAKNQRPDEQNLVFLEEQPHLDSIASIRSDNSSLLRAEPDVDAVSLQRSLREKYDESIPDQVSTSGDLFSFPPWLETDSIKSALSEDRGHIKVRLKSAVDRVIRRYTAELEGSSLFSARDALLEEVLYQVPKDLLPGDRLSKAKMYHAVLLKAKSLRAARQDDIGSESDDHMLQLIRGCRTYFAKLAISGEVSVHFVGPGDIFYVHSTALEALFEACEYNNPDGLPPPMWCPGLADEAHAASLDSHLKAMIRHVPTSVLARLEKFQDLIMDKDTEGFRVSFEDAEEF